MSQIDAKCFQKNVAIIYVDEHLSQFSSKSEMVTWKALGELAWNDPYVNKCMGKLQVLAYYSIIMPRLTSNSVSISLRMLYLSCENSGAPLSR